MITTSGEKPEDKGELIIKHGVLHAKIEGEKKPILCTFETIPIRTFFESNFKALEEGDTHGLPAKYYFQVMNRDNERPLVAKICDRESGEKQRLTLQDELEILALKAFEDERGGNMNFWTMSVDDPEAVYWREVWKKGFLFRQEKSSQSLPIREKPDFEAVVRKLPIYLNGISISEDLTLTDIIEIVGEEMGERIWKDYVEPIPGK
jgi:hypothetical protein